MQEHNELYTQLFTRGVVESIGIEPLRMRMERGERLRVKLGIDPTSPHLHLGRAIPLLKLRDFERAGHQVVLIVGDFTGVIGDTSDKESERPMLGEEEVRHNKETYFAQAGKLLDLEKAELHYNSDWLAPLTYKDICNHADQFSVADFIARDNIKRRLDQGKRVSLREVLYPLMQGYDSVAVRADVELGGTDQRFNLLAGRALQERFGQAPQGILMNPLIPGTDGRKMSSSWGNTITLTMEPNDMYGKVMSLGDELIVEYLTLATRVPLREVEEMARGLQDHTIHPKDAKMRLAREVVTLYHSAEVATRAEEAFSATFARGGVPKDTPRVAVTRGTPLCDVLVTAKVVESKAECRRLIQGGAVEDMTKEEVVRDVAHTVTENSTYRIGKRRFAAFEVN